MTMSKYVDVNKRQYLEALFMDIEKSSKKMVSFDNVAEMVENFVVGNPSNDDSVTVTKNGLKMINGKVVIEARKSK